MPDLEFAEHVYNAVKALGEVINVLLDNQLTPKVLNVLGYVDLIKSMYDFGAELMDGKVSDKTWMSLESAFISSAFATSGLIMAGGMAAGSVAIVPFANARIRQGWLL